MMSLLLPETNHNIVKLNIAYHQSYTRNKIKRWILNVLNRPPDLEDRMSKALHHYFPNVMKAFNAYAVGYYKTKHGKGKRKWKPGDQVSPFAHLTQGMESRIILDTIVPAITAFNPAIPIYTIHDCIMNIREYEDDVKRILETEFEKIFGIAPVIKEE